MQGLVKSLMVRFEGEEGEKLRQIAGDFLPVATGVGKSNFKAVRSARGDRLGRVRREFGETSLEFKFAQELSQVNPIGSGVCRSQAWWQLMLRVFTFDEAVECYLKQFPNLLTKAEHESLRQYLVNTVGLEAAVAAEALAKFRIKPKPFDCRPRARTRAHGVW